MLFNIIIVIWSSKFILVEFSSWWLCQNNWQYNKHPYALLTFLACDRGKIAYDSATYLC